MMNIAKAQSAKRAEDEQHLPIPDYLIYEMVKGTPIYYKGYQEVLNGTKTFEQIKMESRLQSWLKARLPLILGNLLFDKGFDVTSGELGLNMPEKTKRGADISIFKSEHFELDEYFSDLPPEIIIEIDVSADTGKQSEMDYIHEKIEDYLNFGVKKVIWIFSKTKKVMIAESTTTPWLTVNWDKEVEVMKATSFNLEKILAERANRKKM